MNRYGVICRDYVFQSVYCSLSAKLCVTIIQFKSNLNATPRAIFCSSCNKHDSKLLFVKDKPKYQELLYRWKEFYGELLTLHGANLCQVSFIRLFMIFHSLHNGTEYWATLQRQTKLGLVIHQLFSIFLSYWQLFCECVAKYHAQLFPSWFFKWFSIAD